MNPPILVFIPAVDAAFGVTSGRPRGLVGAEGVCRRRRFALYVAALSAFSGRHVVISPLDLFDIPRLLNLHVDNHLLRVIRSCFRDADDDDE
jgi:hypothetical protein